MSTWPSVKILTLLLKMVLATTTLATSPEAFNKHCGMSSMPPPNQFQGGEPDPYRIPFDIAKSTETPWMVRILFDGVFACSGAVTSNHAVVTSASCLHDLIGNIRKKDFDNRLRVVVAAAFDIRATRYGESTFPVAKVLTHGNFIADTNWNINDIAYLQVNGSFGPEVFSNSSDGNAVEQMLVRPICIATDYDALIARPGDVGVVSFWQQKHISQRGAGALSFNGCKIERNSSLNYIFQPNKSWLRIVSSETCLGHFPVYKKLSPADHYVCAQADSIALKSNICCAERGAPLVQKLGDRWYLIGILSQTIGCQYLLNDESLVMPPLLMFTAVARSQSKWLQVHEPDDHPKMDTKYTLPVLASNSISEKMAFGTLTFTKNFSVTIFLLAITFFNT